MDTSFGLSIGVDAVVDDDDDGRDTAVASPTVADLEKGEVGRVHVRDAVRSWVFGPVILIFGVDRPVA